MNTQQLLGGITVETFLRDYWQKRPLLIRNAVPAFQDLIQPKALLKLARHEEVISRMVSQKNNVWKVEHGPFTAQDYPKAASSTLWTILVQELNHHLRGAEALLQQFDFIPHARLDDLMVSYAMPGGGVGPHFDSYDVFLLQGQGQRRWQISAQSDLRLIEDVPLKILQHFTPEEEWVLSTGDMLYLPPTYAHHGVAVNECITYSIGFRAPSAQEIATQFLIYLQDKLQLNGMYQDPDLTVQTHPAHIGEAMLTQIQSMVQSISWTREDIADFLGKYLTEPKAHVYFSPPDAMPDFTSFCQSIKQHSIRLAPQSRMLFHEKQFYLNGEALNFYDTHLHGLADYRSMTGEGLPDTCLRWLYTSMEDGFLVWE